MGYAEELERRVAILEDANRRFVADFNDARERHRTLEERVERVATEVGVIASMVTTATRTADLIRALEGNRHVRAVVRGAAGMDLSYLGNRLEILEAKMATVALDVSGLKNRARAGGPGFDGTPPIAEGELLELLGAPWATDGARVMDCRNVVVCMTDDSEDPPLTSRKLAAAIALFPTLVQTVEDLLKGHRPSAARIASATTFLAIVRSAFS